MRKGDLLGRLDLLRQAWGLEIGSSTSDSPMAGVGIEPDLGIGLALLLAILAMGRAGIEPATLGLKVPCSTD